MLTIASPRKIPESAAEMVVTVSKSCNVVVDWAAGIKLNDGIVFKKDIKTTCRVNDDFLNCFTVKL